MSNKITSLALVAAAALTIGNISGCKNATKPQHLPRFAVMSDTHFGGGASTERVGKALQNLLSNGSLDAVFVVGDLTDGGTAAQYDELLAVFNNPANVPPDLPVYYMMGNHDNFSADGKNGYLSKLRQPMNQYIEIKDYPFITLSMAGSEIDDFDAETQTFLSTHLASAAQKYPDKPIFVFVHIPPQNTCYGSSANGGWGTPVFLPALNKYPQAIVFSGHSHCPVGDPRSIHQGNFTAVNDGGTYYGSNEDGTPDIGVYPENNDKVLEGIIVSVLNNGNVEMERRDTRRNEEILPRWTVEAPHDGSRFTYKDRNGLPSPAFAADATLATTAGDDSCTVTFPQAKDNDVVHHYLIEILDGSSVVASFRKFSQFYLNSEMPSTLTTTIFDLPTGNTLVAQVTAIDSYNNRSKPLQGKPFNN